MTYNQVIEEIKETLENHPMIKEVLTASPLQWLNDNHVPDYPVSCFVINSGQLNAGREEVFAIDMWFLDKSGSEAEFEQEVISDMHGVAYDILQILRQQFNPFTIDANVNWEAISEKFEDYLSGVKITFNFFTNRKYGACDVPTN
jgi:hypothetical protein